MITLNPQAPSCESSSHGSYPTDKEIALLAFEHWKTEGCLHLRLEHWLNAEKQLLGAYSDQRFGLAPEDSASLDDYWEEETATISGFAQSA